MQKHIENLKGVFGFNGFLPGQQQVVEQLDVRGRALAIFPTGGGKSLCYELPALAYPGLTLVVSPLIALMEQQVEFLRKKGVAAACMTSGRTAQEDRDLREQARAGTLKLLYVAPERFNNERFRALLPQLRIALFAVDEAHCISEWGHNFRPDYLKLAQAAVECRAERILALTATATPKVAEDVCKGFGIPEEAVVRTGFHRPNLTVVTTPVRPEQRDALLLQRLRERPRGTTIVYVTRQEAAERVAAHLAEAGLPARHYHAGLEGPARSEVQAWWQTGTDRVVVATIAFGMGIDKPDVRAVYHYHLPKSLESYAQEIGRAGRDNKPSVVELFATAEDVRSLENFAHADAPSRAALAGLLAEVFDGPGELQLNTTELAARLDLRKEVIDTALTYLQLDGYLQQRTAVYLGYEFKLLRERQEVLGGFEPARRQFLAGVFDQARVGRTWLSLDPEKVAGALGEERGRIVKALDYLAEKGHIELRAADARSCYTRLRAPADREALLGQLASRFERREQGELARIQEVLSLVTAEACQANLLAARFGETRTSPCGTCSACRKQPRALPAPRDPGSIDKALEAGAFGVLRQKHLVLRDDRSAARFLCGLTSPGLTKAKLGRHALFGALEAWRFGEVLIWLQARATR